MDTGTAPDYPQIIESILFVAGESVSIQDLSNALCISRMETIAAINHLEKLCEKQKRGVVVKRYGEHLRLETKPEFAPYVERLLQPIQAQSLSQTVMETLAVIAYRQPITKGEVGQIRGVKCDYSIQSLLSKGLIEEVGRKDTLGHPILYGTTDQFLEHFGISDIRELPPFPSQDENKGAESSDAISAQQEVSES